MADKKFNLDFYAKVQTDVGSIKEVVKNLKAQLENLKLPAGATKNFERTFTNLEKSIQDFESVASNGITSLADTKKIDNAWKKISSLFSTLGIQIKDLNSISGQVFPKEASANISKAVKALGEYQAKIEAIKKSQSYTEKSSAKAEADSKAKIAANEWQKQQDILDKKQREYDAKQNAWNQNRAAQYQGQKDQISKITQEIDAQNAKLQEQIEIQKQLRDAGVTTKEGTVRESHKRAITSVEADIAGMEKAQKLAKENLELAKKAEAQAKKAQTSAKGQETKILKKVSAKDPKAIAATQAKTAAMQAYAQAQSEAATKAQELADIEANLAKAKDRLTTLQGQSTQAEQVGKRIQGIEDEIEALDKTREATKKAAAASAEYEAKLNESKQALEDQKVVVASYEAAMNDAKNTANSLGTEMSQMELDQAKTEWEALIKVIKEFTGIDLTAAQGDIQEITRILEEYKADQIKKAPETIEKLGEAARQAEPQLENMKKAGDEVTESITNMIRTERDIENLKDQILDFFSISNTVQIFKDAVRSAIETVKELDAVMTETAVVTEFSVGDMWDKLPEYSDEANKLGTSIASLYEATTLYYQQGLKSQEAMDVGIETMKMARIANMDAAAATEAMTAALRGFNMEINETSATRINDVYSELAAITAADTSQIATAMSKTASIASSANMEFETTAALLAQIIETTQEAPETAGTAMKTIIARFTEVKQLFDEDMLTGKDSEGEEININKIDAALKKVGISLSDFLRGEKGIDDIFLELASKWDSLDLATQRYIATTAAGSRQQSRFLAMMGNYERTMELVTAANNSAGASQKQFDKTLESLEAKLQRLKNAWAEFTMGLANNEVIKGSVDLITGLLEGINNLTDVGSDGLGGLMTTLLRLGTVIMGLKGGKAIIEGLLKTFVSGKTTFGKQMLEGLSGMGLGKALATKGWIKIGVLDALSEQGAQAEEVLDNVKAGFLKAGDGAKLFGKKLLALSPYIAILIAIGAAVYGIVKSFKAAQNEAKLDNINQALEDLNTEAQNAQDELGEIGSARTELKGLQDTLNDLTKGTTEWKSALVDVNHQVLELIEKYPSLEYELGANGALQITEESWDNLLAQQQQVITNMTAQRLDLESQRANIVKDIGFEKFIVDSYGADTAGQSASEKRYAQASMDFAQWQQNSPLLAILEDFFVGASGGSYESFKYGSAQNRRERLLAENENYYVDEVAKNLIGLENQDEIIALAAEFAREGENSQTVDQGKFIEMLETATDREWTDDAAEKLLNSIKEFDKATNSFNDLIQTEIENQSSQESLTRQFTMNALTESSIMEKDYADSIVNIISKGEKEAISAQVNAKANELEASYKDEKGNWKNLEELAAEYARINGFQAVGKEVYRDGTYSEKVDTSPEAMVRALATEAITVEVQEKAETTAGAIGKEKEQEKLFDSLFSTDGQEITGQQLNKYSTEKGTPDFNAIAKDMGYMAEFGSDAFQVMAREMEQTPADLRRILTDNFKVANERVSNQRNGLVKNMTKFTGQENQKDFGVNADLFTKLEQKYGDNLYNVLETTFSKLSNIEDTDFASTAYETLRNIMMEATSTEEFEDAWNFFNTIDFSNPINALETISKEAKEGEGRSKELAQALQQGGEGYLGLSSQISALTESAEFEAINEELSEIIEQNETISEADVNELAKSHKSLNKILKQNQITAAGLGKILEGLNKGELQTWQLTDAVLASASAFDSLNGIAAKTVRNLEEFDLGIDENSVGETVVGWGDLIQENLEKGAVGNSQNFKILDYLFPGWQKDLEGEVLINEMDRLSKLLQGNGQNLRQMWSDIYAGKDFQGNKIQLSDEHQAMELSVRDTGEEIFFEGWEGKNLTSTDLVSWISDAYNVSTELAEAMLTDFKNYSEDLAKELAANDYSTGIEKAYNNLKQIGDIKLIDESELEALGKIWSKSRQELLSSLGMEDYQVTDFYDEEGQIKTYQEISTQLDAALSNGGETGRKWAQSFTDQLGNINLTDLEKELGKVGISGINAEKIKEQAFYSVRDGLKSAAEEGKDQIISTLANGEKITVDITANTTYEEYQQQVVSKSQEIERTKMAEAFKGAFENLEVTPTINENTIVIFRAQLEEAASQANPQINASISEESIATIKGQVTDATDDLKEVPANINVESSDINSYLYKRTVYVDIVVDKNELTGATSEKANVDAGSSGLPGRAKGIKEAPHDETSLVSEEGPELIQKAKGGAYLTGQNGPEIANIEKGDTVYTAEETEQIFKKRNHSLIPGFARGYGEGSAYNGNKGGSGGGKSSDDGKTQENPFDFLYNLLREIQEETRRRERIERQYEKLLDDVDVNAQKLIDISREELEQLKENRELEEKRIDAREKQINQYQKENQDLTKYARTEANEHGEQVLRIDWDAINVVTDSDQMERIETYVGQLEEWYSDMEEAQDTLEDIEDQMEEIRLRGRDEYIDLENKIKEAIITERQEEIDKLSEINNSINDTNAELIDSIQKTLDKQRRERDNQRTEEDLAEKQRRLLYLQQDTSGANDLEILELQKELDTEYEDYTDTLIDQKISELQAQNDEAAKAREQQITLMQAQLDKQVQNGEIWTEVERLMATGISQTEGLIKSSELEALLKQADGFKGLSETQKMVWMQETNSQIALAATYLNNLQNQIKDLNEEMNRQTAVYEQSVKTPSVSQKSNSSSKGSSNSGNNSKKTGSTGPKHWEATYMNGEKITGASEQAAKQAAQKKIDDWVKKQKDNQKSRWDAGEGGYSKSYLESRYAQFEKEGEDYKKQISVKAVYKTGGLADFTGPAWLDGTKSRPEIVLNQQDSRNFIQLRDILSSVLSRSNVNTSTENNGDILYDIDINVESISNDYDVEQVANKVKSLINEDARYRNNNTISLKR